MRFAAMVQLLAACAGAPGGARTPAWSLESTAAELRAWLDAGRSPAQVIAQIRAGSPGFRAVDGAADGAAVRAGQRLLFVNQDRAAVLVIVGREPLRSAGARLIGAHIDTPSLRVELRPAGPHSLTARAHHYGGLRAYQWRNRPLALVGQVVRVGGEVVNISLGLDDELAFFVGEQRDQDTLIITSSSDDEDRPGGLGAALAQRYQLEQRDLEAAELFLVPRERARDVGFGGVLLGAHGQDDRVNAFAAWRAIVELKEVPRATAMTWLVDREEVGSSGRSGARSRFLESVYAYLLRAQGGAVGEATLHRAFAASMALSADTSAAINPNFPEVHEPMNAPTLGAGPMLFPFTGRRGKRGGSAAHAEAIAEVHALFRRAGAALQVGELGRVDEGGGGTIARFLGERGIDVIDVGVPVISMHSPLEISHKHDVWAACLGFREWLRG